MTPVRLEPAALRSRVKHSSTESLCSRKLFYVSMFYVTLLYIQLIVNSQRSVSLKVPEGNIIRHKTLRILKFYLITAFMKIYVNFKKVFYIRDFLSKFISPIKFKICILD